MLTYAAHLGWLNSSITDGDASKKNGSTSKLEHFGKHSVMSELPDLFEFRYIANYWFECGRFSQNGFSMAPLSWSEVESYSRLNGLARWESLIVHAMSRMFVRAKNTFDGVMCECPYIKDGYDFNALMMQAASEKFFK